MEKPPARSESSNEAKTLGESNSGKQKKSIAPNTLTSAADRMLPMMPCSPIEAVVISSPC
jgi:hypothetical protein